MLIPPLAGKAEIIPVEPDQGNACAGKVVSNFSSSLLAFPGNQLVLICLTGFGLKVGVCFFFKAN